MPAARKGPGGWELWAASNGNPCRTRLFMANGGWAVQNSITTWDVIEPACLPGGQWVVQYVAEGVGFEVVHEYMEAHGLKDRLTGESSGGNNNNQEAM